MKSQTKNIVWKFAVIAVVVMALYNFFGSYLMAVEVIPVNAWYIAPFLLLLLSIAIMPFIDRNWWEKNYPLVAFTLGFVVVFYYSFSLHNTPRLFLTSYEYISFISLIGSLFVVSGGVHLRIRGKSTPRGNVALLATGAVIANILGTTGASMLLIRPFIRMNKYRIKGYHVVFFIFLVSNIGGALTPIGDPPLFLGFLKGVPFFWIITRVSSIWILTIGMILIIFYVIDVYNFRKESVAAKESTIEIDEPEVSGLHNIVFLLIIIAAVFIESPAPLMLREVLMWSAALASFLTTKEEIHQKNDFNFVPLKEVAILFAGIFATMLPALDWLELNAVSIGIVTPGQYFWGSGILSSVLDNAPTYLNFLTAAFGLHGANVDNVQHMNLMLGLTTPSAAGLPNPLQASALEITSQSWRYVQAISIGAVFFGANTYIGNGPNFMVKSIAEQSGVQCPSFFGYIAKYSLPILFPIFACIWYLFFRI
ncbi:MAG: sodium:proton antiporter [Ignavibacteriales bacterium]|nr:sodium:proton antiporter [Ignavibacteriales bacterium]